MDPTVYPEVEDRFGDFDPNNENWDINYKNLIKSIEEKKAAES